MDGPTADPTDPADLADPAEAGGPAVVLPAGGVVAAILLAGVGAELVRRRRQFQRHRRPGERLPAAGPAAHQVERAARTAGHEPGVDLLERALAQMADEAEGAGHALPDVRLVRVTEDSIALDLAAPAATALAPFVAADDIRWVLSRRLLAAELPDRPRALPGLVTLGFAGPETILINLESVGTLAVSGASEVTADVIRGFAADLALGPASTLTERTLCVSDPSIARAVEAGGIAVEPDPVRAAAILSAVLSGSAGRAPVVPDPVTAPVGMAPAAEADAQAGADSRAGEDRAGDPLVIVLSDQHLDVMVPPRSGCALITTTPVAAAGATLVVHDSGTAVLLPEREHLAPQHLSSAATRDVVEALSAADLPDADPPRGADDAGVVAGQASLWESPPVPRR